MAIKKLTHDWSMASDRAFVEMAKIMDLNAIAKKTGRVPAGVVKTALRLGISIKGRKAEGK
jgi:hypothetical protein